MNVVRGRRPSLNSVELTAEEKALVAQIDFDPSSSDRHEPGYWNAVGEAALTLMRSLIARKAIPEVRTKYFTDSDFNVGGRGRSRADIFEKNGTRGEAIFRHPHFLKYLHYFLYGPDLPPQLIAASGRRSKTLGSSPPRTSSRSASSHASWCVRTGSMPMIPQRSSSNSHSTAGWNCTRPDQSAIR